MDTQYNRFYRHAEKKSPQPIGGLMDKRFEYVPACKTNVAATIARVKAELANGSRKL